MAWTLDTASLSSKRHFAIAILIAFFFIAAELRAESVLDVTSPNFSAVDLARMEKLMGLQVGRPVDPLRLEDGIRTLHGEGLIQTLYVEATPDKNGIHIVIRGTRLRRLHELKFVEIDSEVVLEAKGQLKLDEGETIDNRTLSLLRERLKQAYQDRGYHSAEVSVLVQERPDGQECDVEVKVNPGVPAEISKVNLGGAGKEETSQMRNLLAFKKGDVLTKKGLEKSVEAIQKYLKANQLPTSKVDGTNLNFNEDRSQVEVNILVKMGERYQFAFFGNTVFSDLQLRELLTDEVLSQPDAAAKISTDIEKKYQILGYHFVRVVSKNVFLETDRVQQVRFDVDEGPRVKIDRTEFKEVPTPSGEDLEGLFFRGAPGVLARKIYWEEGMNPALRAFRVELEARGYLNPGVSPPKTIFTEDRKGVSLLFEVDLGTRTYLGDLRFEGNQAFSADELKARAELTPGALNVAEVKEARKKILELYQTHGYVDAAFVEVSGTDGIQFSSDRKKAEILFQIKEGPQYRVGQVRIQGNLKTKEIVILREMKLKEGDIYDPALIRQSEDDLQLLGLFSRAEIVSTASLSDKNQKDLTIVLRETRPGLGEVGLGGLYEEPRLRLRTFLGVAYRNLLGLNHTANARAEFSLPIARNSSDKVIPFVEYAALLGYRAPYPFSLPLTYTAQVGLDSFEVSTIGPKLQTRARIENRIERKVSKPLTLLYRLHRYERTRTETMASSVTTYTSNIDTIGSTGPGFILDFRDDIFNPRSGSLHTLDIELAHPVLLSQTDPEKIGFVMAVARNAFFVPLISPLSLSVFAGIGYAKSIIDGSALPTARLVNDLSLGGQTSIRGFPVRTFSPVKNNIRPYETAYYNLRAELTIYLFANISAAVFADTGQIFPGLSADPRHDGVGFGFRYKTPVGPVVIDIAQGLPNAGEARESLKFYFTVGTF